MSRKHLIRFGWLLFVSALAVTAGLAARDAKVLRRVEFATVDARFGIRGAEPPPRNIVVVGIDARSLGALGRYPFPRSVQARVIEQLRRAGAGVIAEDIEFAHPTNARDDRALLRAIARSGRVVLATTHQLGSGAPVILGGDARVRRARALIGAAPTFASDPGGSLRRLYHNRYGIPAFAVQVAKRYFGRPIPMRGFPAEGAWVDYRGGAGRFATYSFSDVLEEHVPSTAFRGKIVVIGATDPVLQDQHPTPPAGELMSGPEIQANAISTVLRGLPLRNGSGLLAALMIVGLGLVVPLIGLRWSALVCGAAGALVLGALLVATQLAFNAGTVVELVGPVTALGVATIGAMIVSALAESRERRRMRALFAAYSPEFVQNVLGGRTPPIAPSAIVAGYRMEEVVGLGGMGVVYRATQLALDRTVAVKLIIPVHASDPVFRTRFQRESRAAAAIEHPNVIPVYEAGEDEGLLYIAMRLVEGLDLGKVVDRLGPLPAHRAVDIVTQLAGALDAAHELGLVHRDVKPANVLLTADEPSHAYLTDFGLARYIGGGGLTKPDDWVGTVDYLAPEQLEGTPVDGRADVYALAGLLHYCLVGTPPYPRENEAAKMLAHLKAPPPIPSARRPELPSALDDVVAQGLAKNPDERPATATTLARAAARAIGPEVGEAMTAPAAG